MGHIPFFRRFQFKVTLAFIAAMFFVISLSNLFIYKFTLDSQFESLRSRLMVIARTASLLIDADTLKAVPLNHEGIRSPAYQVIVEKLRKIKDVNPQLQYIYTLTKTDKEGVWQFVVDPDPTTKEGKAKMPTSYPGDEYDAGRFPEMLKAFDGPSADRKLEIDEWGVTLSGYAPILDRRGKAVAILGVDMTADDVYRLQQQVRTRLFLILGLSIILSIILGMMTSRKIGHPVEELTEGTRRISNGELAYRVPVQREDEIGELANSFNAMAQSLSESRKRILGFFYDMVTTLVRILELRDHYTRGHSEAVSEYAAQIARRLGIDEEKIEKFKKMTLLHDIGKLGIKDSILHKKGSLTKEEWDLVKQHPIMGEEILKPVMSEEEMLAVVKQHHERYDGKGYPQQLSGDEINVFAAIVSVADAYHAMTSDRSYRQALSHEEAVEELKKNRGTQFHPKIVHIFLEILKEESKTRSNI